MFSVFSKRALGAIKKVQDDALVQSVSLRQQTTNPRDKRIPLIDKQSINLRIPSLEETISAYKEKVERGYSKSRNMFGSLFDYQEPSSSFLSLYISAGRVSIRQLMQVCSDATFK